jgi:leucyl/phenylalanyl-tRNA--protein transferase
VDTPHGPVWLQPGQPFPDPAAASAEGLLALGGDLEEERLLDAYRRGIFPWYEAGQPILWWSPDPRYVLLPPELHVGRSLTQRVRSGRFEVRYDTVFPRVIRACANIRRKGEEGTWITSAMIQAYERLFELGYAHSIESWRDGILAGGLYGVSLGSAFFGESMFAHESDASKVAFVHLVESTDFDLVDCQMQTDHLGRFGAREMPRSEFLRRLEVSLKAETRRGSWT